MQSHDTFSESILASPAKINLYLKVLGIREDGYHELDTLFYPVQGLYDTIRIEPGHDEHMFMRCPEHPELETTSNLIYKAWASFGEATGFQPGMFVTLNKTIPMGGGLGGGSSNAATVLSWLNENAGSRGLSQDELIALAARLGADIPFFLMDGPAQARGIGEKLTPASVDLSGLSMVIVLPELHVDTPWAFGKWDEANKFPQFTDALTTPGNDTKNPTPVSPLQVVNDLESVVFAEYPELREIKESLIRSGAASAAMSGSGASLFGLFRNRDKADSAARVLRDSGLEIFVTDCV